MPLTLAGAMALTGGLNTGGGLLGTYMTNKTNKELVEKTNQHQIQLQNQSFQHNVDMWNKQNQYNTPAAQMERMKTAGLNPMLMYGQGDTGNAQNAPKHQAANLQAPQVNYDFQTPMSAIGNGIMNAVQVGKINAENDLIRAQEEFVRERAKSESVKRGWTLLQTQIGKIEKSYKSQILMAQLQNYNADVQKKLIALNFQRSNEIADLARKIQHNYKLSLETQQLGVSLLYDIRNFELRLKAAKLSNDKIAQDIEIGKLNKVYKQYQNKFARYGLGIGNSGEIVTPMKWALYAGNELTDPSKSKAGKTKFRKDWEKMHENKTSFTWPWKK